MSRADAQARELAAELALTMPVDIHAVAEKLGATVVAQPIGHDLDGMLLRRDGRLVMGLNGSKPVVQQRFALAHLVGHLRLHRSRDLILDTSARHSHGNLPSMPTDREEAEANRFAMALLAPEGEVRHMAVETAFATSRDLVEALADRFEVSVAAMGYRLMALGVVMDY